MATDATQVRTLEDLPFLDIYSERFFEEPWAVARDLEVQDGLARSERGLEVLEYSAIQAMSTDPTLGLPLEYMYDQVGFDRSHPIVESHVKSVAGLEGPDHIRVRTVLARYLTADRLRELRPIVRQIVEDVVTQVGPSGTCEFNDTIAADLPSLLLCHLLGAPVEDARQIEAWSEELLRVFMLTEAREHRDDIAAAYDDFAEYVTALVDERRNNLGEDFISHFIRAEQDGAMNAIDVLYNSILLVKASVDSTRAQLSLSVSVLADHPEAFALLREDPSLIPAAVLETVRYRTHGWTNNRVATTDMMLGVRAEPGTGAFANSMIAHRDASIWPDPDVFDITRPPGKTPINWGFGPHFCLGRPVAVLEMEEVFSVLAERWSEFRVPAGEELKTEGRPYVNRPISLPLEFVSAT